MENVSPNVLLVEDDLDHKELIVRYLNGYSKDIDHVMDGESALDYLFRRGAYAQLKGNPLPKLVLLDLRLPKIDGLEVLKEIKTFEGLRQIPVVILSSSSSERDVARAYEYNANSYLVKPVGSEAFIKMMRTIASYWLRLNQLRRSVM